MAILLEPPEFGKLIKVLMDARGLTQVAMAKELGCHQSQVSRLCRGHFEQPTDCLRKLCRMLGIVLHDPVQPDEKRLIEAIRRIVRDKPARLLALERAMQLVETL